MDRPATSSSSLTRTPEAAVFQTTLWTMVLRAARPSEPDGAEALEKLCQIYWKPVHRYIRRWCPDWHRAEDLTQAFFAQILEGDFLAAVQRDRGKFRSFVLASVHNFLRDERRREFAAKRGGGVMPVSLEGDLEAGGQAPQVADAADLEREFTRHWCEALFARVFARLESEAAAAGKRELYLAIKPCLLGENEAGYIEIGAATGRSEAAIKKAVQRLRAEFGRLFREEVSQTLTRPDQFEDEVRALLAAMG